MILQRKYDAVVIGSGPNGLAAAIVLARAGRSVVVLEAEETIGGGTRCAPLTLPGFTHDLCSAVHPMAAVSPFLRTLPLLEHGLAWIDPPLALAHPFDDGSAATLDRSLSATSRALGTDGDAYQELVGPIVRNWDLLDESLLGPIRLPPRHPVAFASFGLLALQPAMRLAKTRFRTAAAQALFAGLAAHSVLPLEAWGTSAIGLVLAAVAHVRGWPIPKDGSQRIADALAGYLRSLGGEIKTGMRVRSLVDLPASRIVLCDLSPRSVAEMAGDRLPARFRRALTSYRYGPGAFKLDWALRGPIPWRAPECARAGTVHVGGSMEEIARSECDAWQSRIPEQPFVLLAQSSLFDPSRAPAGCHTAWAYCHVPAGCEIDMTDRIERQVERFAPGFQERILARSAKTPTALERGNANLIGGDITGGANTLRQLLFRPTRRLYATPAKGLYLCSASTPPGGGVHGMCGYHAALLALARDQRD